MQVYFVTGLVKRGPEEKVSLDSGVLSEHTRSTQLIGNMHNEKRKLERNKNP